MHRMDHRYAELAVQPEYLPDVAGGLWSLPNHGEWTRSRMTTSPKLALEPDSKNPFGSNIDDRWLPLLSILPVALTILVIICRLMWPLRHHLPRWSRPFVQESEKTPNEMDFDWKRAAFPRATGLLVLLTLTGIVLHLLAVLYPRVDLMAVPPLVCWVVALILLVFDRSLTTPFGLLAIIAGLFVTQLVLLLGSQAPFRLQNIPKSLESVCAFIIMVVIFNMPMRDPQFPTDGISPPGGEPTSSLRSPEDKLTLWQFATVAWMEPLISLGKERQLHDEDVWKLAYEFHHQGLHENFRELKGSVVRRLLAANGLDLLITGSLGLIELGANYAGPILLQQLLRAMEDPIVPRSNAITYAALSLLVRLIAAQSAVFSVWFCRRCYERSRGEMITMLYEKTLARKILGASIDLTAAQKLNTGRTDLSPEARTPSMVTKTWNNVCSLTRLLFCCTNGRDSKKDTKQPASMGKILNLMQSDVYEVSQRFWEFPSLVKRPIGLVVATVLVWKLIGWPCFLGVVTVVTAQIINAIITRIVLGWERKRRTATDRKLNKTSEFVTAIRHLRWYGWQEFWLNQIMEAREQELHLRVIVSFWRIAVSFTNYLASSMFPVVAFLAYTKLAGLPLRIDIAFPALQLFGMLESALREIPDLITTLLNAKIAVDRIEDFMSEPDKACQDERVQTSRGLVELQEASFAWPGVDEPVLEDISIIFPVGLTVICGKVAAGKSALLQAMLGELDTQKGQVSLADETIGYCAQTPWLQSMSIRENITFSYPFEEARYNKVLEVCALTPDLATFKDGDLSNIGENGIGLSGGQRARVALARAVYSRAKILLLDDPLSALDHQTAEAIVQKCLKGPLLEGRTTVLVTHRVELCRGMASQIVEITDGKARKLDQSQVPNTNEDLQRVPSAPAADSATKKTDDNLNPTASPDKFIEDEHRVHGGVQASVYWEYVKAGKRRYWIVLVVILSTFRILNVGKMWFLKSWGEAYDAPTSAQSAGERSGFFGSFPSPQHDIDPWLLCFFFIAMAQSIIFLAGQSFMILIVYTAGKRMFADIMTKVSYATFRFYDVTPVGRLMNRLTSDISVIDGNISQQFQHVAWLGIMWISAVVVIASVTPLFLIFTIVLSASFVFIFLRFLPTSQSLRRLEMVSLSPLMSNFGALLEGLTTVRAFQVQSRFQARLVEVVDTFQKMDHFYWSLQAWLMYRFDALSAASTFILTMLALNTGVSPGLTAFVLISASQFVTSTHALCRMYGSLQMNFVSVERVVELIHVDQEPKGDIEPPASWPGYTGDIVFEDVTVRYAPNLEPSLMGLSFTIPAGSTTALLGRTGSGKSTLALALLATVVPESGRILIDGIDIGKVNNQALRSRLVSHPLQCYSSISVEGLLV